MLFKNITILDENFEIKKDMYVVTEGTHIKYVGKERPAGEFDREYDGKGKLLMPGFYNSHAHSPMALMRGYGENLALSDWLNTRIFPFEDKLDGNAVYWGTLLSYAESLRFGIVSSSDMYYFMDEMVQATVDSGIKGNISRSIVHFSDSDVWELPSMHEMKRSFEQYHNICDERIKMDMSIHAEYTSNPIAVKAVADYAKENNARMHVHVSETKNEHEECKGRHNGMTPTQYFNSLGLFDVPATAAHCVYVEGEDYDILKEKGVTVATNPISNMKLASGICNVPELLRRGINVAIGTDSTASNNSLNFMEEMKAFALASKVNLLDPKVVSPTETLKAATVNGAMGQGRCDCGFLKEGARADLIVVNLNVPHMHPIHDLKNNLVYSACGSDVLLTMVDGKVLYDNGEFITIDIEKTIFEAEKATENILKQL
ncbi:MAG: amidohydrolase [Firmicutes bacterium]|nr:amidohydrolase [Bacillota bacterium]